MIIQAPSRTFHTLFLFVLYFQCELKKICQKGIQFESMRKDMQLVKHENKIENKLTF